VLGSHPLWAFPVIGIWAVVALGTRWVALGSICAAVALPVIALLTDRDAADVCWAIAIAAVVVVRHRGNVTRWWAARRAPRP
jgi:glycerol-3-phosphate acyltransferase PlsY